MMRNHHHESTNAIEPLVIGRDQTPQEKDKWDRLIDEWNLPEDWYTQEPLKKANFPVHLL